MSNILLVDDDEGKGQHDQRALIQAGHTAVLVCEERVEGFYRRILDEFARQEWDVLVLDIGYVPDQFGGIKLYNRLVSGGYHRHWDHTIIKTKYVGSIPSNLAVATEGEHFIMRVFVETAGIAYDSVLTSMVGQPKALLDRIDQLMAMGKPARCATCQRPI